MGKSSTGGSISKSLTLQALVITGRKPIFKCGAAEAKFAACASPPNRTAFLIRQLKYNSISTFNGSVSSCSFLSADALHSTRTFLPRISTVVFMYCFPCRVGNLLPTKLLNLRVGTTCPPYPAKSVRAAHTKPPFISPVRRRRSGASERRFRRTLFESRSGARGVRPARSSCAAPLTCG